MQKPLTSILVKPAGPDCNLHCDYCFYLEKADLFGGGSKHRMDLSMLEEMIRQCMIQGGSHLSFGWQGGEPTLMGLEFFEKAVEWQKKYGRNQSVGNGLQTNGILIDEKWTTFLSRYQFLVGLSLDGPEHIHDRYRRRRNGKGTWAQVRNSARRMLDADVAVNALVVLNDYSVRFPEEIYQFHKELGLTYMQFIPVVHGPSAKGETSPFGVPAEAFGNFLCKAFDLWMGDFEHGIPKTSIRYFDALFHTYVGLPPPECTLLEECGTYVVVEHNGDVYACDFFVSPEWKLGNISSDSLIELLNSSKQRDFGCMKSALPSACLECRWLKQCRGGCTADRFAAPPAAAHSGLNIRCEGFKAFFEHAHSRLVELADKWRCEEEQAQARARSQVPASDQPQPTAPDPRPAGKPGRNDPCPCGSGLKFKKCCGR